MSTGKPKIVENMGKVERDYFPQVEEFEGYLLCGVMQQWDKSLYKIDESFKTLEVVRQRIKELAKRSNRWPNFWWKFWKSRTYLKIYKHKYSTEQMGGCVFIVGNEIHEEKKTEKRSYCEL